MKKLLILILLLAIGYILSPIAINYMIDHGYTNAETAVYTGIDYEVEIPGNLWEIHKFISQYPEYKDEVVESYAYFNGTGNNPARFPRNNGGMDFVLEGLYQRKEFVKSVYKNSYDLGIDPDLVMACVLGEQIRIANKGARGKLKNVVLNGTPTLFRSYDTSLGIGGIKVSTAYKIKEKAIKYGYGQNIKGSVISKSGLILDDKLNGQYSTYLVKNILTKWEKSGNSISMNPGVVCTLYNMGDNDDKIPHKNPQIGGTVINIGGKDYVYGGISRGVYRYLKIYLEGKSLRQEFLSLE